jgi:hypothetical protein
VRFDLNKYTKRERMGTILAIINILILIGLSACTQLSASESINLDQIIAVPKYLEQRESDEICESVVALHPDQIEEANWLRMGLLPLDNQLKQESIVVACMRVSIALYSEPDSADAAFQSFYEANSELEIVETIYYEDNGIFLFLSPSEFTLTLPIEEQNISISKYTGEHKLLVAQSCNTILTIFALTRDQEASPDTTFGMLIDNDEIVSYGEQILGHINSELCPIMIDEGSANQ